ncbi:EAL domain-containing protein [Vibrio sp. EA2]|uniref:EAL domain-containing protein n=1 Tax=Vibrio sp. EA2 TaxID=3079860 RepID=UPI002949641F|nr:EAL domain-containing protein [Vibrio sp. EA2]MDV6253559.1 EAL domain-containing protein [Vibrio sp. EA2]
MSHEKVVLRDVVWEIIEFKESNTKLFTSGIATFRKSGTKVAVDDYGLHESNAHRVDLLRPDIVKIDRLLTQEYCENPNSFLPDLVERLSSSGYTVVLKGIENSEENKALQFMHFSLVQGYNYGRPR